MNCYYQSNPSMALQYPNNPEPSLIRQNFTALQCLQKTSVLIIEDDRTTRRLVSNAIGGYCNLNEAVNAGNGIAKYQSLEPDIVFLDLELPDRNGHGVLNWIMKNDPGAHVVLFSGNCDNYNVQKALDNGAKGYVPKPFNADLMIYYIGNCPKLH